MMNYKKTAMLIALMSVCQIQTAVHAGKLAKGAAVGVSALLLSKVATSRYQWSQLMEDPNAKKAFEMLGAQDGSKDTCEITYFGPYGGYIDGEKKFSPNAAHRFLGHCPNRIIDARVCSGDECVDLAGTPRRKLELLLTRVDSVEAPILGCEAPGLRRLVNYILTP